MPRPACVAAFLLAVLAMRCTAATPPNLVFILTDNQAPWTLGCYGNPDIRTPHIDRLAREGTVFTRCFSSNAVCSPTRATYLTGLLPSQHGVHSYLRAGGDQMGPRAKCVIGEFLTLPRILSNAGYVCGLSGKWHLGGNATPQEGFTSWTTMPHGHTTTFYDAEVIEDGKLRKEPSYLTDFWTDRGVRFIAANKDRPFFLFLAYNGPYGLGESMGEAARNRHAALYADEELRSFPRAEAHPWLRANRRFLNDVGAMRRYAAEISGVDDGVGRVLAALREHGLDEQTVVVFAADQGLCAGQHGIWGMGDHTRPLSAFDEMMHVPLIWHWPGATGAGQRSDLLVSNYDFLPTVLECLGVPTTAARGLMGPGHSYAKALWGDAAEWGDAVYFEFENTRAVRTTVWKYVERFPKGPNELYDLMVDAGERTNLVDRPEHAVVRERLKERLDAFFNQYADPKYDLKNGGASKTPLHVTAAQK